MSEPCYPLVSQAAELVATLVVAESDHEPESRHLPDLSAEESQLLYGTVDVLRAPPVVVGGFVIAALRRQALSNQVPDLRAYIEALEQEVRSLVRQRNALLSGELPHGSQRRD